MKGRTTRIHGLENRSGGLYPGYLYQQLNNCVGLKE
jgi:hypothetical protein